MTKEENLSTVYGPVLSWRFGLSLGIDPIFHTSTCSFNCVYCQLGNIQKVTSEYKVYVGTDKLVSDLESFLKENKNFDVVTFSGSGEPTLASNLGEMAQEIKKRIKGQPLQVLTNSTMLHLKEVRENLMSMDRVIVKLDASDEETLIKINRPAPDVTLKSILQGIKLFKQDYKGIIDVQVMFMHINNHSIQKLAELLTEIGPDSVQLNTPKRPYPLSWDRESRGNHTKQFNYQVRSLKTLTEKEAKVIEDELRQKTKLNILSIYRE